MILGVILAADDTSLKIGVVFGLLMAMVGSAFASKMGVEIYSGREKLLSKAGISLIVAIGMMYYGFTIAHREYEFMTNYTYVEGRTLGRARCGKSYGAEYEYYYGGQRYTNCASSASDVPVKLIEGRYMVRIRLSDPSLGRMDFSRPVEE